MRTKKEERETAQRLGNWMSDEFVYHLIADVNDAVGLFERVMSGSADGLLLGEIRDYLEEPKS